MSVEWYDRENLDKVIRSRVEKAEVVLDIGCGLRPQILLRPQLHICCEPHPEYVEVLKNRFSGEPGVLILRCTGQEMMRLLPDSSVDTVCLIDVIEHFHKEEGVSILRECERVARRQVIVFTPLGFLPQDYNLREVDGWGMRGGDLQSHRSGWVPEDFGSEWQILACRSYHTVNGKGELLDPSFGAFWAIKSKREEQWLPAPTKFAVISHSLPPSNSGQAVMLYRLLKCLRVQDYCLVSRTSYDVRDCFQNSASRLPATYYRLPRGPRFEKRGPFIVRAGLEFVNMLMQSLQLVINAIYLARILKAERCAVVVACSGDLYDLPVGFLASKMVGCRFYAYMFDYYSAQWARTLHRILARSLEPLLVKRADGVIVPNESLRDEYQARYQIQPVVVHNPLETDEKTCAQGKVWPSKVGEIRVVFTGAVYHAHYDAFRNLVAAIHLIGRDDLRLHLYTSQFREELEGNGIRGPVVYHGYVASSHVAAVQAEADILFLPLAFHSPVLPVIRTSSPGKMGEYLATGRPILVHTPPDSFVAKYFRVNNCGVVVDQNDPSVVADAVRQIIENPDLRVRLGAKAQQCAARDFSLQDARRSFLSTIEGK